jgi:uncharacterized membrane protein YhhN
MALSGLGDTALLGAESAQRWFVPGMGAFAAAHACYITALARDGAARGVRPRVAAGYAALWAVLIAVLWRRLGPLRVPVAAYSLLLVSMAVLASGRNRAAAAGGALFVVPDALIACGLAGISAVPRQEAAVMPTYVAAQFLLAAGFLNPRRGAAHAHLEAQRADLRPEALRVVGGRIQLLRGLLVRACRHRKDRVPQLAGVLDGQVLPQRIERLRVHDDGQAVPLGLRGARAEYHLITDQLPQPGRHVGQVIQARPG